MEYDPRPVLQSMFATPSTMVITESRLRRTENNSRQRMSKVAVILLCYPVVYIWLIMPVSIARLAQFSGQNWGVTAIQAGGRYLCLFWVGKRPLVHGDSKGDHLVGLARDRCVQLSSPGIIHCSLFRGLKTSRIWISHWNRRRRIQWGFGKILKIPREGNFFSIYIHTDGSVYNFAN